MLIDKDQMVKIQWSDNYRQYYINKGYKYTGRYNALEVKVSDLPERSSVLVKVRCDCCGKEYDKRYSDHLKSISLYGNDYCKSCMWQRTQSKRTNKIYKRVMEICDKLGYKLLTSKDEIRKYSDKIRYVCPKHGEHEVRIYNLVSGKKCPECGKEHLSEELRCDLETIVAKVEACGGKIMNADEYINNSVRNLRITCPRCGNEFVTSLVLFTQHGGQLCQECFRKESVGELRIRRYLEKHDIRYEQEKLFSDCYDIRPLPFDFYLPETNTAIEFDGSQHYGDAKQFFHESYSIDTVRKHDEIKNEYCKNNDIKLIRIPYWKMDQIDNYLDEQIIHMVI